MEAEKRTVWKGRKQRFEVEFVVQTMTESGQWETLVQERTAEEAAAEARTWVEHWEGIVQDFESMDNELPGIFQRENKERERLEGIGGDEPLHLDPDLPSSRHCPCGECQEILDIRRRR